MNKTIITLLTAGAFISAAASFNAAALGGHTGGNAGHHPAKAASADTKPEMVNAEVKKLMLMPKKSPSNTLKLKASICRA